MISVIVPVYNIKDEYLKKCLESLKNQTDKSFEAIIVDDGSKKSCSDICDLYKSVAHFKVIHKQNEGVSVARNYGIKLAKGNWICFVDGDDWIELDTIENLKQIVKKANTNSDLIILASYINYENKQIFNSFVPSKHRIVNDKEDLILQMIARRYTKFYPIDTSVSIPWAKLYKRSFLFEKKLLFLPGMIKMQDLIFNLYAFKESKQIEYFDYAYYHYLKNNNSISRLYSEKTVSYYEKMFLETEKFLDKYKMGAIFYKALQDKKVYAFNTYMSNYFFNKHNHNNYKDVKKEIISLLESDIYKNLFNNISYHNLSMYQKLFVFCLKKHYIYFCRVLVNTKSIVKNIVGGKIKK